ncbi:MAG: HPr(Ser) kinase/phosphatase, partial [Myxococcota bacterium]
MDLRTVQQPSVTVASFFEHASEALQLELCAGAHGMGRALSRARIQKPGLALAGYTRFVHRDRVQILGETELSYLETLPEDGRIRALDGYLSCEVACILVTKGLPLPDDLVSMCDAHATPLFRTQVTSSVTIRKVLAYLDDILSPRCSVHGTLVDVNGVGVLMTGDSGIGKSETALDLIERGHRLVADDVVEIRRRGEDLVGQASRLIQNLIEIRGLGILDIAELFGVAATREHKRIELHIELATWSQEQIYDRTGLDEQAIDVLGVDVRSIRLPVKPGRNIAGIVEVAARNMLLRIRGHHAARQLNQRLDA